MIGAYHNIYSVHMHGIKAYKKNTESQFNKAQVDPNSGTEAQIEVRQAPEDRAGNSFAIPPSNSTI